MNIRQIKAKISLWWYFRNRKCYVCGRSGNEELQSREVRVWPCTQHAKQVSDNLKDLTSKFRVGDHVEVIAGVGFFNAGEKCVIIHHKGFRKYEIQSLSAKHYDGTFVKFVVDEDQIKLVLMAR